MIRGWKRKREYLDLNQESLNDLMDKISFMKEHEIQKE